MIQHSVFSIQKIHRYFFYLLLILLPTQLGRHFWPDWALVLGRRVDYLSPTLYLTDVLIIILLLFWFVGLITRILNHELGIVNKTKKLLFSFRIQHSVFMILLLFAAVNVLVSVSRPVALYKWAKVLEFGLLAFYIIKTKPRLSLVVSFMSLTVMYSSILAITQFLLQHSIGGPFWFLGERTFTLDTPGIARIQLCNLSHVSCRLFLRPYATLPHPNVLGGFLAAMLPLILFQISDSKKQITKIFYGFTFLFGLIALFLTFSRSAWVVGGFAIALAIARIVNSELGILNKKYILIIAFIMILYSVFMIQSISPIRSADESVVVRQQLNNAAITVWKQSPIVGVGLGNFLVKLPDALPSRQIYFLQPVHNIYLLLLSETGVVGVGILLLFVVYLLNHEYGILNHGKNIKKYSFTIQYSLFSILLLGLVDHYPLTLQQGQLLLTLLFSLSLIPASSAGRPGRR
jgi:O-antigen ligase